MSKRLRLRSAARAVLLAVGVAGAAFSHATDVIGQVKVLNGSAAVERVAHSEPARVGTSIRQFDTIRTGPDSSIGITFVDNTVMSLGPNSVLYLDRFAFNPTTHEGRFDSVVRKGTLSVISGKIAKQSPEAVSVKTPTSILGVRGTEFFVQVDPAQPQQ